MAVLVSSQLCHGSVGFISAVSWQCWFHLSCVMAVLVSSQLCVLCVLSIIKLHRLYLTSRSAAVIVASYKSPLWNRYSGAPLDIYSGHHWGMKFWPI